MMADEQLGALALQLGLVQPTQLQQAQALAHASGDSLAECFQKLGLLDEAQLGELQADATLVAPDRPAALAPTQVAALGGAPGASESTPTLREVVESRHALDLSWLMGDRARPQGQLLGRHGVVGLLGAGGMGQVFEVEDSELGRRMAAKVVPRVTDRRLLERFLLEARVTGMLEHPGIVPIHEFGVAADGQVFFTMKKVVGETLSELLERAARAAPVAGARPKPGARRRKPPRAKKAGARTRQTQAPGGADDPVAAHGRGERAGLVELLGVFVKVCDAIAFAHSEGVIHRDLKPSNIMVGAFGEVLTMDWGLAKLLAVKRDVAEDRLTAGSPQGGDDEGTLAGSVIGTPAYMPPEQAKGEIDKLDVRSDIYSLGAILYQILTLQVPFEADNPYLLIAAVVEDPVIPPIERAPDRNIPWELQAVVLKAMAKARGERYRSVAALRADIVSFLQGVPLAAADYSAGQLIAKWLKRNTWLASGAAAALIGAVAFAGVWIQSAQQKAKLAQQKAELSEQYLEQRNEARTQRDAAQRAFERAQEAQRQAEQARGAALAARQRADDARLEAVAARDEAELLATLQGIARRIDEARPYFHIASVDIRRKTRQLDEALVELRGLTESPSGAKSFDAWRLRGMAAYFLLRFDEARTSLVKARTIRADDDLVRFYLARSIIEGTLLTVFVHHNDLPALMQLSTRIQQSAQLLAECRELAGADRDLAVVLNGIAAGEVDKARATCDAAIKRHAGDLGLADLWLARGLGRLDIGGWIALAKASDRQRMAMQATLRQMQDDWKQALASRPHYPQARILRALMHKLLKEPKGVVAEMDAAIDVNPDIAIARRLRAVALIDLDRRKDAIPDVGALIDLDGPEREAENRVWRAELYARTGDMRSARRDDEIALAHADWKRLGRRDRLNALARLAIARRAAGEHTAASEAAAAARKLAKGKERDRLEKLLRANGIR